MLQTKLYAGLALISLAFSNASAIADPGHSHADHERGFLDWAGSLRTAPKSPVRTMLVGTILSMDAKTQTIEIDHSANALLGLKKGVSIFRCENYGEFPKGLIGQRVRVALISRDGEHALIEKLNNVIYD